MAVGQRGARAVCWKPLRTVEEAHVRSPRDRRRRGRRQLGRGRGLWAAGPALVAAGETAGLVVLGSRGAGARLGTSDTSVGLHVGRHAQCPMAVVPDIAHEGTGMLELDLHCAAGTGAAARFALAYAALHDLTVQAVHPIREPALAGSGRERTGVDPAPLRGRPDVDVVVLPAPGPDASPWGCGGTSTRSPSDPPLRALSLVHHLLTHYQTGVIP